MAFWELHDEQIGDDYTVNVNTAIGLPCVGQPHRLRRRDARRRSTSTAIAGAATAITVAEVDHDFCISIYTTDPNRNMVEFCHTTRPVHRRRTGTGDEGAAGSFTCARRGAAPR